MKTPAFALAVAAALGLSACAPTLADDVDLSDVAPADIAWIDETPVYPNATIAENIAAAEVFSHLEVLVERVGLVETLDEDAPLTIFAPTDSAFDEVPPELRAELARPEAAEKLREVVASHVVAGRLTSADLIANIEAGGGTYEVPTLSGDTLAFRMDGPSIVITVPDSDGDGEGERVLVTQADIVQANGMMHVIDGVLLP